MKIVDRWDASRVLWEGEAASLKEAVERAVSAGANLAGANLAEANLAGAKLAGAKLTGADLAGAKLAGANLAGAELAEAYLAGAELAGASLTRADLTRAKLTWANLTEANLDGASLEGANLEGANLAGASLEGANLAGAKLNPIRDDIFAVLATSPNEADGLLLALNEGRIDGSAYAGSCACLVGTIANVRGCSYTDIPGLRPNSNRPAERWFLAIRPGNKPDTSQVAAITAGWIQEWIKGQPAPVAE